MRRFRSKDVSYRFCILYCSDPASQAHDSFLYQKKIGIPKSIDPFSVYTIYQKSFGIPKSILTSRSVYSVHVDEENTNRQYH